jgi:hypothetical protein
MRRMNRTTLRIEPFSNRPWRDGVPASDRQPGSARPHRDFRINGRGLHDDHHMVAFPARLDRVGPRRSNPSMLGIVQRRPDSSQVRWIKSPRAHRSAPRAHRAGRTPSPAGIFGSARHGPDSIRARCVDYMAAHRSAPRAHRADRTPSPAGRRAKDPAEIRSRSLQWCPPGCGSGYKKLRLPTEPGAGMAPAARRTPQTAELRFDSPALRPRRRRSCNEENAR